MESFSEGFLGAIVVQEGGVANVGAAIAFVAETEAEIDAAKSKAGGTASVSNGAAPPPPAEVGSRAAALLACCYPNAVWLRIWQSWAGL